MGENNPGFLLVISGPSGAGKGTIIKELLKRFSEMSLVTSWTTREPRPNERDGVEYHFVSKEAFQEKVQSKGFLEWASIYYNFYGTPLDDVKALIARNKVALLEIDVQGARSIRTNPQVDGVSLFIAPPDMNTLANRLRARGTDDEESVKVRLREASREMEEARFFDYIIFNDVLEKAVNDAEAAIRGEFHRSKWVFEKIAEMRNK